MTKALVANGKPLVKNGGGLGQRVGVFVKGNQAGLGGELGEQQAAVTASAKRGINKDRAGCAV
ncbi:MAG: hypothetical protein FD135_1855 [Comamonadaceae bacterium]|nr:MAG: hypothetical protein FD135_1855 [Comamonadaceae bacterium]